MVESSGEKSLKCVSVYVSLVEFSLKFILNRFVYAHKCGSLGENYYCVSVTFAPVIVLCVNIINSSLISGKSFNVVIVVVGCHTVKDTGR